MAKKKQPLEPGDEVYRADSKIRAVWVILSIDAAGATFAQGALSNTAPWNVRLDEEASGQMGWIFDQLSPAAGSITPGSSYSDLGGGMFFNCMIGSFELSKGREKQGIERLCRNLHYPVTH
jgi:hypothetical protein